MFWNVYRYNINKRSIEVFNVFKHERFAEEVKSHLLKYNDKEIFAEELKRSLLYYFWCKSEYEVYISGWESARENEIAKVDIYSQIINNWKQFVDYVWAFKK